MTRQDDPTLLAASDLECVRGDRTLFSGVSFTVMPGAALLVQGPNGAGKTSLLRIALGLARPSRGEVTWEGRLIHSASEAYRREIAYCGHASALKDELTAAENVRAAASLTGGSMVHEEALRALALVGVEGLADLPLRSLSQGQKRRIALARLVLGRAKLWVLDEPLAALDAAGAEWLGRALTQHLAGGGIALVTSHQPLPIEADVATLRLGA